MQFNVNLLDTESKNSLIEKIRSEKEYRLKMIKEGRTDELINGVNRVKHSPEPVEASVSTCSDE